MKLLRKLSMLIYVLLSVFILSGCEDKKGSYVTVLDGYISGAIVTDYNEQVAVEISPSEGLYMFATVPAYPIKTAGGIIVDTNEKFDINMTAYYGNVISPISTFIQNDKKITDNLKQSMGFISDEELLGDYIASNNTEVAKLSAMLYAVLKDSAYKQVFQNRLRSAASNNLFAAAIEDANSSSQESFITEYINAITEFNSNAREIEIFLISEKKSLVDSFASALEDSPPAKPINNILFAHGLNADEHDWDAWVDSEYLKDWNVYLTSVTGDASIANRASELTDYINKEDIEDDSMIAVGHSMGGLDLHYIISKGHEEPGSKYYDAAKKIHKVYTIASPHKGNQFGGTIPISDGVRDLGLKQMQQFNKNYPYTTFKIDERKIPLMALRFECVTGLGADGVVSVQNQSLNGAPHSKNIYLGKHASESYVCPEIPVLREQDKDKEILNDIILANKNIEEQTHDIVFYEGNNCSKDEKGIFSSSYETQKNCESSITSVSHNSACDNDEIRSVEIFPSVKKNTIITVYDEKNFSEDDDWAIINVGNKDLTKSICINSFESSSLTDEEKEAGISKFYHKGTTSFDGNFLDGKISSIKIQHSFESQGKVIFYEGKNCEQNVRAKYNTINNEVNDNCKDSKACKNDEIKSVLLFPSVEHNTIISLYDDQNGKMTDDWLYINRGSENLDVPFCINDLEHNTNENEKAKGVSVYYAKNNGLNGKVSHVKIAPKNNNKIVFFEGENCTQNVELSLSSYSKNSGDADKLKFQNDEIRSVLLFPLVKDNTIVKLYDSKKGSLSDDWLYINRGSENLDVPFCINDLEHTRTTKGVDIYYQDHGGLNGKVSYIKTTDKKDNKIVFFEGNDCTQNVELSLDSTKTYAGDSDELGFQNDEIRSVLLQAGVKSNKTIKLYDDKDGDTHGGPFGMDYYGWAEIEVKEDLDIPICVNDFNEKNNAYIKVNRHNEDDKLEGKVSRIVLKNN